jgi:ribonuclease HI
VAGDDRGLGEVACRGYGAAVPDSDPPSLFEPSPGDEPIVVYTDGACSGNPGPGGWAWAVAPGGVPCDSGGEPVTTNQRMEITAALEAVRAQSPELAAGRPVEVVSDSTYVVNCFRDKWYVRWQANGWRNARKQPVANADLWKPLVELVQEYRISFRWVKGHGIDPLNELVDRLAVAAIPR